jgi:hypothetical protein
MGAKRAPARHWETDRLLSELVLERTRRAAARRAQQEPPRAERPAAPARQADAQGSTSPRRIA